MAVNKKKVWSWELKPELTSSVFVKYNAVNTEYTDDR